MMVKEFCQLEGHKSSVNVVRFTFDGHYCMTGSDDRTINLYNPHKMDQSSQIPVGLFIKKYDGVHGYSVLDIAILPDKSKFISAGEDKAFYLMDVASGQQLRRFQGHSHRINALDLNEDGTVIITASYDQTMKCWDLRSNMREPIQVMNDFKDSVTSIKTTDHSIISGCVDGKVRIYDLRTGLMNTDDMIDPITCISIDKNKNYYLCNTLGMGSKSKGSLKLVQYSSGKVLNEFIGHQQQSLKTESRFESHSVVISGSEDGRIYRWDLLSNKLVGEPCRAHSKGISSIAYHPEKPFFISASYDGSVKCWNRED